MAHFIVAALMFLSLGVPIQPAASASFCECLAVRAALDGLTQLRAANWQGLNERTIRERWPRVPVLPCAKGSGAGLEAAADYLAKCCAACELCGGVSLDERETPGTFRLVDIWMSRDSLEATDTLLRSLTTVVLPGALEPTSTSHSEARIIDGYSWVVDRVLFKMRVDAIQSDGVWVGHFQVGSCASEGPVETWRLGNGRMIPVVSAKAHASADQRTVLSLSYLTQCLLQDRDCFGAELDALWPRLRSLAGGRTIAAVDIDIEDCLGSSTSFQVTQSTDRKWAGALWTPKTP